MSVWIHRKLIQQHNALGLMSWVILAGEASDSVTSICRWVKMSVMYAWPELDFFFIINNAFPLCFTQNLKRIFLVALKKKLVCEIVFWSMNYDDDGQDPVSILSDWPDLTIGLILYVFIYLYFINILWSNIWAYTYCWKNAKHKEPYSFQIVW